ncbi:GHMP kinase [Thiomicrorhabdus sp. ZW0627]|uniref:mevalonate kinase family protein n=1 Tax=Thiomicrorhabdus sp. ZW0627 TaxID=3039774 RepID=UPI0024369040|nr:GHMP kinase [Thiomicrorhabdus sp. ZW0627]MDG6773963.1 GHMP kinase [Thiomicrorhabdus sp. ZW0627]
MNWISRAPANLMLMGEHSVVYGHPALACAVDQFIEIEWQSTDDGLICIESELSDYELTLEELKIAPLEAFEHPKLRFVIHALKAFAPSLQHGLQIVINSDFSSTVGLGSSAAVLAASLHGLNQITEQNLDTSELFQIGRKIILAIQGRGSATDLAASLTGGVIYFQPQTPEHQAKIFPLNSLVVDALSPTLIYSGYKTPTAEVLKQVAENWETQEPLMLELYQLMGNTTHQACIALSEREYDEFYRLCSVYQGLMEALGVSDSTLSKLIYAMESCGGIHAAKISGSGLGDCVLGFGDLQHCPATAEVELEAYQRIHVQLTPFGASTETLK